MTLIEAVFAVAMLVMLVTIAASATSFLIGRQAREQHMLACVELANRLMLQYLDDQNSMPSRMMPVAYGDVTYRWSMDVEQVDVREPERLRNVRRDRGRQTTLSIDRIRQVTIRVWLSEDHGGSYAYDGRVPTAAVTRLYDPLNFARNPDSMRRLERDDESIRQLINQVIDAAGGAGFEGGGSGSGGGGGGGGGDDGGRGGRR